MFMTASPQFAAPLYDMAEIMGALYGPGFLGLKGAFSREWTERLREDLDRLYHEDSLSALEAPEGSGSAGN
jgi:hypothetical protein